MRIQLTTQGSRKVRQGYPLIQKEDLAKEEMTTNWVELTSPQGEFLAMGYLGKQNKGIGWVLSDKKQAIDEKFFVELFQKAKTNRQDYYQDQKTTAFRLFNGEGDGLGGLIIDLYQDYAVFSWYNDTLYGKQATIIQAFQTVFPEVLGAYEKIRFESQLPESQFLYGEMAS